MNEEQTKFDYITPALLEAGWHNHGKIELEYRIAADRIRAGNPGKEKREPDTDKKADYCLRYNDVPLAIVEAKAKSEGAMKGYEQAKDYARRAEIPFAFSTDGLELAEYNFLTHEFSQRALEPFPTPQELWTRYLERKPQYGNPAFTEPFLTRGGRGPRFYQERAVYRVLEAIDQGEDKVLITLATGTGKTVIAFHLVWKLIRSGRMNRVLFLADRVALRGQAFARFEPFGDEREEIEGRDLKTGRKVYFGIYQTMYAGKEGERLYQTLPRDYFDLIIIDEAHRSGFGTWHEILEHFNTATRLGMTATPKRKDNIDTYGYFGEPVYSYSMAQGIEDGYLAPFRRFVVSTNVDKEGVTYKGQTYQTKDYERKLILPERTQKIAKDLVERMSKVSDKMDKTIVFCVNQNHARDFAKAVQQQMKHLGLSNYAVPILSEERTARQSLKDFSDTEKSTPVVVTSVEILTTGVDAPTARNIVILRPISSQEVFKQIVGRGARIWEEAGKNKLSFNIIDYVKATEFMRDDDWMGTPQYEENDDIGGGGDEGRRPKPVSPPEEETTVNPPPREPPETYTGLKIYIAEEAEFLLTADGRSMTQSQYRDYARLQVKDLVPDPESLRSSWRDRDERQTIVKTLEAKGIQAEALAFLFEAPDSDTYDLLAHLAFGQPLRTREERVTMLQNKYAEVLEPYSGEQLEIVEALLSKYVMAGIKELETADVFHVYPLSNYGDFPQIAGLFGGSSGLRTMVNSLEQALYEF